MRAPLLLAATVAAFSLAACGGDTTDSTDAAATQPSPSVAQTAPADMAAAESEVKENWASFFSPAFPNAQKPDLLADSASVKETLDAALANPAAKETTSEVTAVTFTSPTEASVTYDLTFFGNKVITGGTGAAVLEDGAWKVSKDSFCFLQKLSAQGKPVPGCA